MKTYDELKVGEYLRQTSRDRREVRVAHLRDPEKRKVGCYAFREGVSLEWIDISDLELDPDADHHPLFGA